MAYTLEQFCTDTHDILKSQGSGDAALDQVAENLQKLLVNPDFIAETFQEDTPAGRRVLYHDGDTDFYVLAHVQEQKGPGTPHSHGSSWAVYGNIRGRTHMTEWKRVNPEDADHAEIAVDKRYDLTPGKAQAYGSGKIHNTEQPEKCWVIRVTGTDLENVPRFRFDRKKDKILEAA